MVKIIYSLESYWQIFFLIIAHLGCLVLRHHLPVHGGRFYFFYQFDEDDGVWQILVSKTWEFGTFVQLEDNEQIMVYCTNLLHNIVSHRSSRLSLWHATLFLILKDWPSLWELIILLLFSIGPIRTHLINVCLYILPFCTASCIFPDGNIIIKLQNNIFFILNNITQSNYTTCLLYSDRNDSPWCLPNPEWFSLHFYYLLQHSPR